MLSPSDFIAKTKLDFQEAAKKGTFLVPTNTPSKFPKILKYVDGMASMGMDYNSVCYSEDAVAKRVKQLEEAEPNRTVVIQDFIRGYESMVIVVEMGSEVVALPPADWEFDPNTPTDKAWLTFGNKFEAQGSGILPKFVVDEPRRSNLCKAAIAAFKALGMQGRGGWGRVDMRCEVATGDVYCLEVNHMPAVFYPEGDEKCDDIIINEGFPGGHEAFFEVLLFTKAFQLKQAKENISEHATTSTCSEPIGTLKTKGATMAEVYDNFVGNYDQLIVNQNIYQLQVKYFAEYSYSGTVLDLACGTGCVGMIIHQTSPDAQISGIDISPLSLQTPQVLKHYTEATKVGYIQDEVMGLESNSFDHVVCFGALYFLDRTEFLATLSKMFMVSHKTVMFDVCNVSTSYISSIVKCFGEGIRAHNNVEALRCFGVPKGWKKVIDEEALMFHSPAFFFFLLTCCIS
jgi:2-polyprenyl-3-methyl-5-hydroxy-6-metoxy-1,4-benzoquinol methylase